MATADIQSKDPYLPPMCRVGDLIAPKAPHDIASAALEEGVLTDLAVKAAFTVARLTTDWLAKRLNFTLPLVQSVLDQVCRDGMLEETMQSSQGRSHYRITQRGREYGARAMEACGYIGPAPVSMDAYSAMLRWQFSNTAQVKPENVTSALSSLVLSPKALQLAGLAVSSGRSLFVYGPSGNGKSSLGRQIHAAIPGDYWIPYTIGVGNSVIRLYDDLCHHQPRQR